MHPVDFIAKHFSKTEAPVEQCNTICAFTGKKIDEGIRKKKVIKANFTDHQFLRYSSNYISKEAYLCMSRIDYNSNSKFELRKYSFLATQDALRILQRADIIPILLDPPDPPFVLSFTASNKKHRSFKSEIATSRTDFPVSLDALNCYVKPGVLRDIIRIMQEWYAILPGKENTEQQPTYFNQNDLRYGNANARKIERYGINKYFKENQVLERYRYAPFCNMLILCTKKGVVYVDD